MIAVTNRISPRFTQCLTSITPRPLIDLALARSQHAQYRSWLVSLGVELIHLEVNQDLADGVFVEDTAVITPELAVITPMGASERAKEPKAIAAELAKHRELHIINPPAKLEGGDVLRMGRRIWVGLTRRSNRAGIEALRSALAPKGYSVEGISLRGCLHLKSAVTPLDEKSLLLNPAMVEPGHFAGYEIVQVHPAEPYAGNVLNVGGAVLANAAYPRTMEILDGMGYAVSAINISEFMKADAALTCPSLIF